jgi:putative ABC transport system ATP-binding protein
MTIRAYNEVIKAIDLVKVYGKEPNEIVALNSLNIEVYQGEFVAIMGPSGSGKSTLLHCLAGLDNPTSGEVMLAGKSITHLSDNELVELRRGAIGFMFQTFNLIPTLNAFENIILPAEIANREIDSYWLEELLNIFEIKDRLNHRPNELSGGQQQRVAAIRALILKPLVVFADEPTGNLDRDASKKLLEFLRLSVERHKQTIVMVTHDPLAASYSNRVIYIRDGLIVGESQSDSKIILEHLETLF